MHRVRACLVLLAVACVPVATAQRVSPAPEARMFQRKALRDKEWTGTSTAAIVQGWRDRLDKIEEAAQAGEWETVSKRSASLLETLRERLAGGESEAAWYGTLSAYRALAHAGLGDRQAATWWWWTAQQVWEGAAALDLSAYGDVGLAVEDLGAPEGSSANDDKGEGAGAGDAPTPTEPGQAPRPVRLREGIEAPVLRQRVEPAYPVSAMEAGANGEIVLEAVIGEDGAIREPRILKGMMPALNFAALDALRQWRYEPARKNGAPQAVYLIVRLKFTLAPRR